MKIINAVIESVTLDDGDRGLLTSYIFCNRQDGGTQGFGGYALYLPESYKHHDILSHAGHWIFRCMQIAEVSSWDKMKGKTIRIKVGDDGLIKGIGHIIKEDWFMPGEDFAKHS